VLKLDHFFNIFIYKFAEYLISLKLKLVSFSLETNKHIKTMLSKIQNAKEVTKIISVQSSNEKLTLFKK